MAENLIFGLNFSEKLLFYYCKELKKLPEQCLRTLKTLCKLEMPYLTKLEMFNEDFFVGPSSLELSIERCDEIESLPEQDPQHPFSLKSLKIQNSKKLKSLPEGIQHLTSLQRLMIRQFLELAALPDTVEHLISLSDLCLDGLDKLKILPDVGMVPFSALQYQKIVGCPSLASLPKVIRKPDITTSFKNLGLPKS